MWHCDMEQDKDKILWTCQFYSSLYSENVKTFIKTGKTLSSLDEAINCDKDLIPSAKSSCSSNNEIESPVFPH